MSTMEQALREMLEEALACMEGLAHDVSGCEHLNDDYFKDSICTRIRARLAALTAALPAPGVEAPGDWVAVMPEMDDSTALSEAIQDAVADGEGSITERGLQRIYAAVLEHYAAPSAPAEISQAQAQAMREALQEIMDTGFNVAETPSRIRAREILAALTPEPPR